MSALVGGPSASAVRHALAVLSGALADEAAPIPLRGYLCGAEGGAAPHANLLSPAEVAALMTLPGRDRAGFAIRDEADFACDVACIGDGIALGNIVDRGVDTGRALRLPVETFARHTLVAGHTGSGKSTTVRGILRGLAKRGVPFLVLEPAKGEYRSLAASIPELCVLRAGEQPRAGEVPFCLNPFSFPEGFPFGTHVDLLKQTFVASFGLVPPLPYLLETAIYRAYEGRGWDLATGEHPNGHDPLSFPVLGDLVDAAERVIDEAGYSGEISRNLRAALRARLGSLRTGPKGLALDTRESIPDEVLFGRPLVLELKHLGSDEEKAFVMGLVIARLYEVREAAGRGAAGLTHLLVVEEAHRLLRAAPERSSEDGNMAHQAVRAFANVLAEVRAYGQGVLVVEQIPSLLAAEVVKHAGTKIVHRLPPRDDRETLAGAMALDEEQTRALAVLGVGEAVVHADGLDAAIKVRVPVAAAIATLPVAEMDARARAALGGAAERLLRAVNRRALRSRLDTPAIRRAAERTLLAVAAGVASGADAAGEVEEAALEEALLRRALHYGWTLDRLDDRAAIFRALSGHVDYEAALVADDPDVREAMAVIRDADAREWGARLRAAAEEGVREILGWDGAIPVALAGAVVERTLRTFRVTPATAARLARLAMTEAKP